MLFPGQEQWVVLFRLRSPAFGGIWHSTGAAAAKRPAFSNPILECIDMPILTCRAGVLGWMRGMVPLLKSSKIPIRVNCIGPSWTITGLVPQALVDAIGGQSQGPEVAARSVAILMADEKRQGNFIYSWEGRFLEIEQAKYLPVAAELMGSGGDAGEEPEKNVHDIEKLFDVHGVQPAALQK